MRPGSEKRRGVLLMAYITQSSIESIFGVQNVAEWSNLENDGTGANTATIALGISFAEEYVEDRFRDGPYVVPFVNTGSSTPRVVVDWCARMAGAWLYRNRPQQVKGDDRMSGVLEGIENEMDAYIAGARKMQAARSGSGPSVPVVLSPGDAFPAGWSGVIQ